MNNLFLTRIGCLHACVSVSSADPAHIIATRVNEVMTRTGGVAREVNRFLIECAGDGGKYDRDATQVYFAKFRKLLTGEGANDFVQELRSSFSIIMAGLHLHYPVPFSSIPALWRDSGIVVLADDDRTAQFVCPAQKRAVDELFHEPTHAALTEAVQFLVSVQSSTTVIPSNKCDFYRILMVVLCVVVCSPSQQIPL